MWKTLSTMNGHSTWAVVAWVMLTAAALTGSAMVVLGMFEDLAGIVGAASRRSADRRRPAARPDAIERAIPPRAPARGPQRNGRRS